MGEWITISNFVDNDIIRASKFQDIWANLYSLKDGEFDVQYMPGNSADYWSTASATFVPVDTDYYRIDFESFGGDLLIVAINEASNSDAASLIQMTVVLDGVALGGSNGLFAKEPGDIFEAIPLIYAATGVSAGQHTIYMAMRDNGVGSAKVFKKSCMHFFVMELS